MKLGLISHVNRSYSPGDFIGGGYLADTTWQYVLQYMYPAESFYSVDMNNPDFDILRKIDVLFYSANCLSDAMVLRFINDVPCIVITHLACGQAQLSRYGFEALLAEKKILDSSDIIISMDHQFIEVYRLFTKTPVFWWPLPYPVTKMLKVLGEQAKACLYDILIPYSPLQTVNTERNAYISAMTGSLIMDEITGYNSMGIFSWVDKSHPDFESAIQVLTELGCHNFEFIPHLSGEDTVRMIAGAKLFIDLDRTRAAGRWMIETGLARVPVIASSEIPFARYIYGGLKLQDPFDVSAALETARMAEESRWPASWFDIAFKRACDYSIENATAMLEGFVNYV